MARKRDPGKGITVRRFFNANADNAAIMNNILRFVYGKRENVDFRECQAKCVN